MLGSFYYLTLLVSLKALFALAFQDNSTLRGLQTAKDSSRIAENLDSSSVNGISNKSAVLNVSEPNVNISEKNNVSLDRFGLPFNVSENKTKASSNDGLSSKKPEGRNLKDLSAGEEYLLSVASMEDIADGSWENLPFLKSIIKKGMFYLDESSNDKMKESPEQPPVPSNMMEMMSMMSSMKKADGDDDNKSEEKPSGFLAKLGIDPMNVFLVAAIPFSLLLAAVIPVLTNQLMTGIYIPSVYTIATGERRERSMKVSNSTEFFVPILESIASFSAKAFEEVTKETPDEVKSRFVKEVVDKISHFVSEKWIQLFGGMPGPKLICSQGNCTNSHISGTSS